MVWLRLLFWVFPVICLASSDSGSIMLINDSPFILSATIQASDGTYLGQFTIQPGQQQTFTTNLWNTDYRHPGTPNVSLTPYTVVWQCPSQGFYSMCSQVSPGSLCTANQCPGPHFCSPKSEYKEKTPASTLEKKQ